MDNTLTASDKGGTLALRNAQIAAQRDRDTATMAARAGTKRMATIDKAAKNFEAVFATEMLKPMFADINTGKGPFGGGHGEKIFGHMLLKQYGEQIADRDGLGIQSVVKAQLLRLQEAQPHAR